MDVQTKRVLIRDSFDRFGDDLCELLLSYLKLMSCFRLECVSKQWKTVIYNRQHSFVIDCDDCDQQTDSMLNKLVFKSSIYKRFFNINNNTFATILGKCQFITTIEIKQFCIFDEHMLNIMRDNCLYLSKLICASIHCERISEKCLTQFALKCSPKIKYFRFDGINDRLFKIVVRLSPNIKSLCFDKNNGNFSLINSETFTDMCYTTKTRFNLLAKLESISISCYSFEDLKLFTDSYHKQIKVIGIKIIVNSNLRNNDNINNSLIQLSRYELLESLTLAIYSDRADVSPIDKGLVMIGLKCKKLSQMVFEMTRNLKIESKLFHIFGQFSTLKSFKILTFETFMSDLGTIEYMKSCKKLTHISLYLRHLSDEHLKDIDSYLPLLKSIKIDTLSTITDNTLHSLAKMQNLSTIKINGSKSANFSITDAGICDIIRNCINIRTLILFCATSITSVSIQAFNQIATNNPKVIYKLFYQNSKNIHKSAFIDENGDYIKPPNLSIYYIPI